MSDLQCPARIFVARHGDAGYDRPDVMTDEGGRLTPRGREEALVTASWLRGERVAAIYTSPLSRSVETAEVFGRVLEVQPTTLPGVEEFWVGDLDGHGFEEGQRYFGAWLAGQLDLRWPGGETGNEVIARMTNALDYVSLRHRGEAVVVVSHGGIMSLTLPRIATGSGVSLHSPPPLATCAIVRLEVDADGWRFVGPWPGRG